MIKCVQVTGIIEDPIGNMLLTENQKGFINQNGPARIAK
jgi:hypothetical protein